MRRRLEGSIMKARGSADRSSHALRVEHIRFALRPLFPRVVAPLEGRSSGFRISRCYAPSQSLWTSGLMRRSSPVTATGSRRIFTGFPQVGALPLWPALRPGPPKSVVRLSLEGTPSTVGGPLRISPLPVDTQEAQGATSYHPGKRSQRPSLGSPKRHARLCRRR